MGNLNKLRYDNPERERAFNAHMYILKCEREKRKKNTATRYTLYATIIATVYYLVYLLILVISQ